MRKKRIILTGGGTTGHVAVNLALIPRLKALDWDVYYMGSETGIEKELLMDFPDVEYIPIRTGKLRRYLSMENVKDVGNVFQGIGQATQKIAKIKPDVIFSKGGFVSVPVVMGGRMNRVPSITHESDLTPGLANKLITPFVTKVMVTFSDSMKYVDSSKGFYLGPVIRDQIKNGDPNRGREAYGFRGEKPILVVMGGSLGAKGLNEAIWQNLDALLARFDILHGVGKGKAEFSLKREGYVQVEYIKSGMNDVLAMSDLIISRAGANAIFEFLYYNKPMVLIPLPAAQSRGDQYLNAAHFTEQGFSSMMDEETMTKESFLQLVNDTYDHREVMKEKQKSFKFRDTESIIIKELEKLALPRWQKNPN